MDRYYRPIDPVSIIVPFKTPFWLNKGWFVTYNYIKKFNLIRIYSIPVCVSNFYYVSESDQVSYSTHSIMNNDPAMMDNVHVLVSDLTKEMFSIVPSEVNFKYRITCLPEVISEDISLISMFISL